MSSQTQSKNVFLWHNKHLLVERKIKGRHLFHWGIDFITGYLKFPGWFTMEVTGTCLCAFKYVLLRAPSCKDKSFWGIIGDFLLRKWMDLWIAISQAPKLRAVFVCPFPPHTQRVAKAFLEWCHSFLSLGWGRREEGVPFHHLSSVILFYMAITASVSNGSLSLSSDSDYLCLLPNIIFSNIQLRFHIQCI